MHLMTFDPDYDFIWGHPTGQPDEISSGSADGAKLPATANPGGLSNSAEDTPCHAPLPGGNTASFSFDQYPLV